MDITLAPNAKSNYGVATQLGASSLKGPSEAYEISGANGAENLFTSQLLEEFTSEFVADTVGTEDLPSPIVGVDFGVVDFTPHALHAQPNALGESSEGVSGAALRTSEGVSAVTLRTNENNAILHESERLSAADLRIDEDVAISRKSEKVSVVSRPMVARDSGHVGRNYEWQQDYVSRVCNIRPLFQIRIFGYFSRQIRISGFYPDFLCRSV